MIKPSIFVGSSSEGLDFARAIRSLLSDDAEITMWNEGFFGLGSTFIESLVNSLLRFDFAVLVLTPDDLISSRETETFGPRDNVIFELGLFMGHLGRLRTFIVHQSKSTLKLPTDLSGMTTATYTWPREDKNHKAAVGAACDNIREVIRDLGISDTKLNNQIQLVSQEQQKQRQEIETLSFLVTHFLPANEFSHLEKLATGATFPYEKHLGFEQELRRLWNLNLIIKKSFFKIVEMPQQGDLKNYFELSEQGRTYLRLRTPSKDEDSM
jgi:hypothetical protein